MYSTNDMAIRPIKKALRKFSIVIMSKQKLLLYMVRILHFYSLNYSVKAIKTVFSDHLPPLLLSLEPSAVDKEPSAVGKEPSAVDKEPSASGKEPSASGKEPSASGKEPSASGKEPSASGKEPSPGTGS